MLGVIPNNYIANCRFLPSVEQREVKQLFRSVAFKIVATANHNVRVASNFRIFSPNFAGDSKYSRWKIMIRWIDEYVCHAVASCQTTKFVLGLPFLHILLLGYNSWVTSSVLCPGTSPYGPPHHLLPIIFVEIHMDVWCLYVVDVQNIHQKWPPLISVSLAVVDAGFAKNRKICTNPFSSLEAATTNNEKDRIVSYLKKQSKSI